MLKDRVKQQRRWFSHCTHYTPHSLHCLSFIVITSTFCPDFFVSSLLHFCWLLCNLSTKESMPEMSGFFSSCDIQLFVCLTSIQQIDLDKQRRGTVSTFQDVIFKFISLLLNFCASLCNLYLVHLWHLRLLEILIIQDVCDELLLVVAATSKPEVIDSALRRPGRFDREIEVGVPTAKDRFDVSRLILLQFTDFKTNFVSVFTEVFPISLIDCQTGTNKNTMFIFYKLHVIKLKLNTSSWVAHQSLRDICLFFKINWLSGYDICLFSRANQLQAL